MILEYTPYRACEPIIKTLVSVSTLPHVWAKIMLQSLLDNSLAMGCSSLYLICNRKFSCVSAVQPSCFCNSNRSAATD